MSVATAKPKKKHGGLIAFVVILLILILALAAVAAVGYVYAIAKPTEAVKRAEAFIEQGSYVDAYQTLNEASYPSIFGIDKLTEKKTGIVTLKEQLIAEHPTVVLHNAKVGDVITYGHYEQDGDETNGAEPIEWIILETATGYQKHDLKPGDAPEASFAVTEPVIAAYEYCNLHGLWMAKA